MPFFTVNIAVYNQLDNLKLILEALDAQTFNDFEIIICDDGSSDGTKEWVENYVSGVKYFWQEDEGFRLAKSKNNGIRAAEGKYFISLEGDVIPHYNMLAEYRMWAKPDLVLYGVRHDVPSFPKTLDYDWLESNIIGRDFRLMALRQLRLTEKPWRLCSGCNVLMPTDRLKEVGGWNESFKHYGLDDYEVCLRLHVAGCEFAGVSAAYGYHKRHEIRETIKDNLKLLEEAERIFL